MLESLSIRNVVLAKAVEIDFAHGFCVLTGETGAGKSILLDALGLALGVRADAKLIRHGETQASVTATFSASARESISDILNEQGIEDSGELIIRRVLSADGKSKAFINDQAVGVQLLQQVGERLVEIHGQHDQHGLLSPTNHRTILDDFGGHAKELSIVAKQFITWKTAADSLEQARGEIAKAKQDEEYLTHILKELDDLSVHVGEEAELDEKRRVMMNREKIVGSLSQALGELETQPKSVSEAIRTASRMLERAPEAARESFTKAIEAFDRALTEIDEAESELQQIARDLDMDGNALESLEDRLYAIRALARKLNVLADELPVEREKIAGRLKMINHGDAHIAELEKQAAQGKKEFIKLAEVLSEKRKKAARKIEKSIAEELAPLKMEGSKVQVEITALPEEAWGAHGFEKVQFLVQTNPGSPFGALSKIASGGELSRFMLALKVVLSDTRSAPTLIFDEIDTGIGGAVADAVGRRLAKLGATHQVLAVTHQPQVAALGVHHLKIEKHVSKGETITEVSTLPASARSEELARMLAGNIITDEARQAAKKLMGVS
ncbi:MAG: DNA repair protein RecN [Proteobacteria bacterium]|nr:DNA repair protein RecN [Pseudomonadota bacterium]